MSGALSQGGERAALNGALRDKTLYVGLSTSAVTRTTSLSQVSEPSDTNYARQQVTFKAPTEENGKTVTRNSNEVTFGPWANNQPSLITHCFITDAASGTSGEVRGYFALEVAKMPTKHEPLKFPADFIEMGLKPDGA